MILGSTILTISRRASLVIFTQTFLLAFFWLFSCATARFQEKCKPVAKRFDSSVIEKIEHIELAASFKGKLNLKGETFSFSGRLRSALGKMARLEVLNPIGSKVAAVFLFSDERILLFLPDSKTLLKGRATSESFSKLIGIRMNPSFLMNYITGKEFIGFLKDHDRSSAFTGDEAHSLTIRHDSCIPPPCKTDLVIHYNFNGKDSFMTRNFPYFRLVPSHFGVIDNESSSHLEISMEKISIMEIYGENGQLLQSYRARHSADTERDGKEHWIYSEEPFLSISGVSIIELESIEPEKPILSGSL
ncbi:MAG: hypothetical protein AB1756_00845 [Acidobacteriota bacterium]